MLRLVFMSLFFAGLIGPLSVWGENIPDETSRVVKLLAAPASCTPVVSEVIQSLLQYRDLLEASSPNPSTINQAGSRLQNWIGTIFQSTDDCRTSALRAYATGSIYLLIDGSRTNLLAGLEKGKDDSASIGWFVFTLAGFRQNMISFEFKKKADILGFYNCWSASVSVNPVQRPLNLAAALIHEYAHFFNDRLWISARLGSAGDRAAELDVDKVVMLDEVMASVLAAYHQRRFYFQRTARTFRPRETGDLSFFNEQGPFDRAHGLLLDTATTREVPAFGYFFQTMMSLKWDEEQGSTGGQEKMQALGDYRQKILNIITQSYFTCKKDLSVWSLWENPRVYAAFYRQAEMLGDISLLMTPGAEFHHLEEVTHVTRSYGYARQWFSMYTDLSEVVTRVATQLEKDVHRYSSNGLCAAFQAHPESLKCFVGFDNELEKSKDGKPGTEGGRPGTDGVRMCRQIGDSL